MENRKGARKIDEIPSAVLEVLNRGQLPTVNLVEWLAIDQRQLLQAVLPISYHTPLLEQIESSKSQSALALIKLIGTQLYQITDEVERHRLSTFLQEHPADIPRCWAAIMVGQSNASLAEKLQQILPFAKDNHFGVREIAWIAIREDILSRPEEAFKLLLPWTTDANEYVRRFASESTRPKGVWCRQFSFIQEEPTLALPLLENLQADSSKYVQDSVANWLNDLSKSQPQLVKDVCSQWTLNHPQSKATAYIVRRALRSFK
ncbi:DNA alkylation repair protein [Bacteroides coprosuis]|uniref:DNA alkylation repair protein n=1 Tax=Bacteroides coprosuis TaxID=151276 RepID=UPI001D4A45FB|nr:DNA alkylation repair protein [Bacteroides coprosuis]HJD91133.1 DNA alkylation repair protein [Bacteroides coprosuis]